MKVPRVSRGKKEIVIVIAGVDGVDERTPVQVSRRGVPVDRLSIGLSTAGEIRGWPSEVPQPSTVEMPCVHIWGAVVHVYPQRYPQV
jgi:hypothetical protein